MVELFHFDKSFLYSSIFNKHQVNLALCVAYMNIIISDVFITMTG